MPGKPRIELIAWLTVLLLFSGFLWSRMFMNIGVLTGSVYALINHRKLFEALKKPISVSFIIVACIPLISDFLFFKGVPNYSSTIAKLLLIFYPLFLFTWNPDREQVKKLNYLILIFAIISALYSISVYLQDVLSLSEAYKRAKVMKVLAYRDHIRISWFSVISCFIALYELQKTHNAKHKLFLYGFLVLQVVFIHLLTSKTGLILLYSGIYIYAFISWFSAHKLRLITVTSMILLLPVISYFLIPTFKNRIDFIRYDFNHYIEGRYRPGLSDALRYYSIQAGMDYEKVHPFRGTGYSGMMPIVKEWYAVHQPKVPENEIFLPSSQYLIYWMAGGMLALMILIIHLLLPYSYVVLRRHAIFQGFYLPTLFSFTFETHFEGQMSLFVYGFFSCWFMLICTKSGEKNTLKP
ncbi:MAG: O-antigen ligase family protein [Saprospiraceae bacterium]|nr:O-antigen ligase family protein [Saprospiraceae bacterium]MCB9329047.1 O-antigen ligase family protein [Lewinellaceae bacterium]HPK09565.1 O-antigen ligase family protein [Saprospiraceae bacterium]